MPSAAYTIILAVHIAALTTFSSTSPGPILALASPMPMPLPPVVTGYSHKNVVTPGTSAPRKNIKSKHDLSGNHTGHTHLAQSARSYSLNARATPVNLLQRQNEVEEGNFLSYINLLNLYSGNAADCATNYSMSSVSSVDLYSSIFAENLAARSASVNGHDDGFQRQCTSELTGYYTNLGKFGIVLGQLGADKGLADYDKSDQIETLLKDTINDNKDLMSDTATLVNNTPYLGPILGPSKFLHCEVFWFLLI